MTEAYIVDAVRTPTGKRGGGLSQVHPADLGAHVISEVLERNDVDPMAVDDVVFGCVDNVGPQAGDIARTAWLAAGLPEAIPGTTVDRQCGSGQQAVSFAAMGVMAGLQDLVVAGGVQNMSMIPIGLALQAAKPFGHEDPFSGSTGWVDRYGTQEVSQFRGAEMIAEKWDLSARPWRPLPLRVTSGPSGPSTRAGSTPRSARWPALRPTRVLVAVAAWRRWRNWRRWSRADGSPQR